MVRKTRLELPEELEEIEETQPTKRIQKEEPEDVKLVQVATQVDDAFKLPDGKVLSFNDYLVWLGNQVLEIRNAVV